MAKYIDADNVRDMLDNAQMISDGEYCGYCTEDISLDDIPTADVVEVKWIPVTERLPKVRRDYLCICVFDESDMPFYNVLMFHPEQNAENGYVTGPHFSNEGVEGLRVTHWMPLPKLPCGTKMDGKENEE